MRFYTLRLQNFLSHEDTQLPLHDQGLVLIEGRMCGSAMAESNGSGKTSLLPDGVLYALFGRTSRGVKGKDVVRHGARCGTLVQLTGETDEGVSFTIQRPQQHPHMRKLQLRYGDSLYEGEDQAGSIINQLLGHVSFETVMASLVLGQGWPFFTQLDDARKKTVLEEILGLTDLSRFQTQAKEFLVSTTTEIKAAQHILDIQKVQKEGLEILRRQIEEAKQKWDVQVQELELAAQRLEEQYAHDTEKLTTLRGQLVVVQREHKTHQAAVQAIESKIVAAEVDHTRVTRLVAKTEMELTQLGENMARIQGFQGTCPLCFTVIQESHRQQVLSKLQRAQGVLQAKQTGQKGLVQQYATKVEKARGQLSPISAALKTAANEVLTCKVKIHQLEQQLVTTRQTLDEARERWAKLQMESAASHVESLADVEHKLATLDHEMTAVQTQLALLEQKAPQYDFWVKGFGNSGVKSYLMDGVLPTLNASAQRYADVLTNGEMQVHFSLQTVLKSGETREKFDVAVTHRDHGDYWTCSGGQRRRADIITTLALGDLATNRIGQSFNLVVLDEVFEGLDGAGIDRVMELLKVLAAERSSVFVITHLPRLADYFPRSCVVEWKDGVSHLIQ